MASSSTYVPPELEYEMPPQPEPVVVSRSEAYLTTPSTSYDTDSNKILRFSITGDQMLDLSSIRIYADMDYKKGGNALDGAKDFVADNLGLFESIEIATASGVVIERIDDANLLSVIMSHLCFGEDWSNTTGSYSNSQKALMARTIGGRFEINALRLCGFLHSGKFVQPSILGGGIVFTLTLASGNKLVTQKTVLDSNGNVVSAYAAPKLTLTNVKMHYDLCIMSQRYQEWYYRQYATKGFRIVWDSYQGHTTNTVALPANEVQVPIQVTAKRCKAIVMVLRKDADVNPTGLDQYPGAFLSTGFVNGRYQLDVAGVRYPPSAIDSYARAHTEAVKVCYSNGDVQTENIPLHRFAQDWASTNVSTTRQGQFLMCLDFEKYNSSGESGIVIAPNAARFSMTFGGTGSTELATYLVRSQSLTVVGGQVVVDY